jgi:hypothetical protein
MTEIDLQQRLDELKLKGTAAFAEYKSSRKSLYNTFARAYTLWRQCELQPNFLQKEYKKAGITANKLADNRVNFRPFIRLVFGISAKTGTDNNKVQHWANVLNALDDDYNERPAYYAANAEAKLIAHIEQQGGITEIVKRDADGTADDDEDAPKPSKSKKDLAAIAAALAKRRIDQLITQPPKSFAVADKFSRSVSVDKDGLVAFIGKRNAAGKIEIVATSIDPSALQSVAVHSMRDYADDIDPSLRTLAEIIHTQTFPQIGMPSNEARRKEWRRVVEVHETTVKAYKDELDKKTGKTVKVHKKLKNPRRLLILGDRGMILLGRQREHGAAVTTMKPRFKLCGKDIVVLRPSDRVAFEDPIVDGTLAIYRATPSDKLTPISNDPKWHYHLLLENTATNHKRTIYFENYRGELGKSSTNFQLMFDAKGEFKPTWQFTADKDWFIELRAQWLDEWFRSLGLHTRILRSDSKVFEWKITPTKLAIRFEIDDDKHADKHSTALPKCTMKGAKSKAFLVASMDLAPVLFNLTELALTSKVTVSGDEDAVTFSYSTDMGHFCVALPTYKRIKGKPDASTKHFSKV